MKIVADENIPMLDTFFSDMGELQVLPGRLIRAAEVQDADILLVRSVTQVNAELLAGSAVKLVGSATIGEEHLDKDYLEKSNIHYASAPGSNAASVINYVISALSVLSERHIRPWTDWTMGIIGLGNIGGGLADMFARLGVNVLGYDPFKPESPYHTETLDELLSLSDAVSVHVPLTHSGVYPTEGLVDKTLLKKMKPDACLINTSRGAVVNEGDLLAHLNEHWAFEAVLDVWQQEPHINVELMDAAIIATPHIAGYSLDGKLTATEKLYQVVSEFLGLPIRYKLGQLISEPPLKKLSFSVESEPLWAMNTAIRACYDVRNDDFKMRKALHEAEDLGMVFDLLRRDYPVRRDFSAIRVEVRKKMGMVRDNLQIIGFDVRSK